MSSHSNDLVLPSASNAELRTSLPQRYPPNQLRSTQSFSTSNISMEAMKDVAECQQSSISTTTLPCRINHPNTHRTSGSITLPPIVHPANAVTQDPRLDACASKLGLTDREALVLLFWPFLALSVILGLFILHNGSIVLGKRVTRVPLHLRTCLFLF